MRIFLSIIMFFLLAMPIQARIISETVNYSDGKDNFTGYLSYDDKVSKKVPGVLIVHEWWGLNEYAKMRARQIAELGYIAFAVDMYGDGKVAETPEEASKLASQFYLAPDRSLLRQRVNAGLSFLKSHPLVDVNKIVAIGYCFGGTTVLELARSGANICGVVSFHGGLSTPNPEDAKNIKCKILVCHGGDDPHVPLEQVLAFQDEMRIAGVDWQMIIYGGAVHSFTNTNAGNDPSRGSAYNQNADRRSWQALLSFFKECFSEE